jgi:hypothetical protein
VQRAVDVGRSESKPRGEEVGRRAFEPTSEFSGSIDGASLATGDGELINVGERLKNGDGVIVVTKQAEADALAGAFFLQEIDPPAEKPAPGKKGD